MNRKIVVVILMILLCSFFSGCGYKDLDKRYFVVAMGVDKPDKDKPEYNIVLKLAVPSADVTQGSNEFEILIEKAETITEAVRILKSKVDKELDFGHTKMILFGESVIEEDITSLLYWFTRRRDIQNVAWVAVADPTAEEILRVKTKSERIPSNSLFLAFGQTGTESAYIISKYLFEFRRDLFNEGRTAVLPVIKASGSLFDINHAVLFDHERKKKLTLTHQETKILNMLQNHVNKDEVKVKTDDLHFMMATDGIFSRYSIEQKNPNEPPTIQVKVDITGTLEEAKHRLSEEKFAYYSKEASKDVKNSIEELLIKFQKENVDPMGFGIRYRASHFNNNTELKDWNELYPLAKFDIQVSIKMKSIGLVK